MNADGKIAGDGTGMDWRSPLNWRIALVLAVVTIFWIVPADVIPAYLGVVPDTIQGRGVGYAALLVALIMVILSEHWVLFLLFGARSGRSEAVGGHEVSTGSVLEDLRQARRELDTLEHNPHRKAFDTKPSDHRTMLIVLAHTVTVFVCVVILEKVLFALLGVDAVAETTKGWLVVLANSWSLLLFLRRYGVRRQG